MWFTEGKGDEDIHVHHFQRYSASHYPEGLTGQTQFLRTQLPVSPISYHGKLLRICWCLRLRLFIENGKEIVAQHPFVLLPSHAPR